MLKLVNSKSIDIPVTKMKDGDLAVITSWNGGYYIGTVVQRYNDILIPVGEPKGNCWTTLFEGGYKHEDCRVRLLTKGETLIVE